jgi:hypothetical protein
LSESNNKKYIGLVKWFRDKTRDANYGFIQHATLGDLFFHERSIEKGQDINSFRENTIVVFASQESKKHTGKLEAVGVKYLEAETDLIFLFNHFLSIISEKGKYSDYTTIQKSVHLRISSILDKSEDEQINEQLFNKYLTYLNENTNKLNNEEYLIGLLKIGKGFFSKKHNEITEFVLKNISIELAHNLWLNSYLSKCQIDYISNIIFSESELSQTKIFNKCSEDEKTNIFFKILFSFDKIDTESKLNLVKKTLNLSRKYGLEKHEKVLEESIKKCPDYFKLSLWLEGFYNTLDFHIYKIYVVTLSPEQQKKFVKKVLKYIHEKKVDISLEDLTSLSVMDIETSKLAEKIDNSKLDYSTSIVLNLISELNKQTNLDSRKDVASAQNKLYDIIIKLIQKPEDILEITGFFDECEGRCKVSVKEEKNEIGDVIKRNVSYSRNEYNKAKNHPICDGRKAIDGKSNTPILSEEKVEFWWCANQKCFKPSRQLHSSDEWEKYSLLDFLTILKVNFKESDFEIYLNIINKANRFLKHLNCRECNHILYPKGKSQYAFYGVSNFICKTESCSLKEKEIYLSHCLNGFCEMEIDSRDSVRCKPNGFEADTCGWYVCNYCHSCCSSEQLQRRKWVSDNILHSDYKCHLEGHRNLGIISCNKCGDSMVANETNIEEFNKVLNWFIDNKDKSSRINKSGKNKFDKWWFSIRRGPETMEKFNERLIRYYKLGFQIPDLTLNKEFQLISEPVNHKKKNEESLVCKSCGNILDLSNDIEKARAVKTFHNKIFMNEISV